MLAKARSTFMARGTASGTPMPPKHHPSGSFDKPEDVWNSNKELIKKKAKKKQRLAAEGLDPEAQRVAPAGRARSGLGGSQLGHLEAFSLAVKGGLPC